jgi:hypothetical protein
MWSSWFLQMVKQAGGKEVWDWPLTTRLRLCLCYTCVTLLQLLDELLKEEHVMNVIGCLEYDPDLQTSQQHRQFLSTAVVFKEVVPITSQDVLSKIHQTYRIQYLKDVILPRR